MKHSENVEAIKKASVLLVKQALMGIFIKWIPAIASGPFNYVAVKLATKLAEELAERGELLIFFEHIDFRTSQQGKDFVSAMLKNRDAQISGTEDDKKQAEEEVINTSNILIHLMR